MDIRTMAGFINAGETPVMRARICRDSSMSEHPPAVSVRTVPEPKVVRWLGD